MEKIKELITYIIENYGTPIYLGDEEEKEILLELEMAEEAINSRGIK